MSTSHPYRPDPRLDLVLERVVTVPKRLVWAAWTEPDRLKRWFTPAPWTTTDCEIDLRPGGMFRAVMQSPEGQEFPHVGCYLEVVQEERLVWTSALEPGFRPAALPPAGVPQFTAIISLEPQVEGTRYTAVAMHRDETGRSQHEAMGFHEGWSKALNQLVQTVSGEQLAVSKPSDVEIRMTRLFNAPRALVFDVMTKPENIKRWWGNLGEGYSVPVCEVDFRLGGAWRFVNRHPKGEAAFHGEYREIAPPGRVVFTEIFEAFPDSVSVVTAELTEEDGRTRLTATVRYPSREIRDMVLATGMARGAGISYDRLDDLVIALQRR